jgi:glucose 1-dehydrogenase
MKPYEGKVALVTGGNKGIGKGIALEFAKRGAKVAIGCNQNPEMAKETLAELNAHTEAIVIQADIASPQSCEKLVRDTVSRFGALDILVNNAALQTHHSLLESNLGVLTKIININLRSAFILMKNAHEYLKKSGEGRIIIISSVHGKRPLDFDAAYCVAKGGLEMLTREAAVEFAGDGITVNSIAPAAVKIEGKTGSPNFNSLRFKKRGNNRSILSKYRLGRIGLPSDTANLACFLASAEACHITGANIRIDGGAMLL